MARQPGKNASAGRAARAGRKGPTHRGGQPRGSGLLLGLLCVVLFVAPLPLGANRVWAWAVLECALFILMLGWIAISIGRQRRSQGTSTFYWCCLLMGLWLVYGVLYLVSLDPKIVAWLAPEVHAAYTRLAELFQSPDAAYYLTIDRQATVEALLKYGMYAAAFFLVAVLATDRLRLKLVFYTILASGAVQVLLALWARAMDVDLTPQALMDGHWDVLRGTFVNRNHFAAFLAMTAAAGIGLSLASMERPRNGGPLKARIAALLDQLDGPVLITAGAVLLIGAGMIMSTSRGGLGALFGALAVVLVLALIARGRRARELVLVWPLAAAVLGALAWPGSRSLLDRLATSGLVIEERWVQWAGTRDLIIDHWLTGTGPGTYRYAFTAYKDEALRPLLYDHAHNDYLQLLAEQGIVGAGLLSAVVIVILFRLGHSFVKRRDMFVRGALFASLTGMLAILVHSLVEFNFQIPANALYFWVLAGAGLAATRLGHQESGRYGLGVAAESRRIGV